MREEPQPPQDRARCLLCDTSEHARVLFRLQRPVFRCRCGLVYSAPPDADAAPAFYSEDYYRGQVYADYTLDRQPIRRNALRALRELAARATGRRLLDVGCALGFFLETARDQGWSVSGIEVSEYAGAQARGLGLQVLTTSILSVPDNYGPFDVVTLWDVIEHLERPDLALRKVRGLMRPGGILMISTGDFGSLLRRVTGRRWRLFADPTHVFFFDRDSLGRLLSRCGFDVVKVRRRGKCVGLGMIAHQSPVPFAAQLVRWLRRLSWNPSLYVNLWDVMTVTAVATHAGEPPAGR